MRVILLALLISLALTATAIASKSEKVTLRMGQQKTAVKGDLKIKFLAVPEDSRCPTNAQCIWAGNAKVRIQVTDRRGKTKTFEANTSQGPRGDQFGGYAIRLESLTPEPAGKPITKYTATISVERLVR